MHCSPVTDDMWYLCVVLQVNSDVFLGRYMDHEEDFERMDTHYIHHPMLSQMCYAGQR
jgi:hypothetical protein